MVSRRPGSLTIALAVTLSVALLFLARINQLPLEAVVAVPFVLFLPGFAISYALFPRQTLGGAERLLVSVTASITAAILAGVLLNLTPWGLQINTWLFALTTITILAGVAAFWRGHAPVMTSARGWRLSLRAGDVALYGVTLLLLATALQLARVPAPADRVEGYTSLWLLPGQTNPYTVNVGFTSSEAAPTRYRLELLADDRVYQEWDEIFLQPGQSWASSPVISVRGGRVDKLEALLYRADQPETVYRRVHLRP